MLDLSQLPGFMESLQAAMVRAAQTVDLVTPPRAVDADNEWLTTREACAFLRMSTSAWKRFKTAQPEKVRVSYALGSTEPRYQLASLQALMRERNTGRVEARAPDTAKPHRRTPARLPQLSPTLL